MEQVEMKKMVNTAVQFLHNVYDQADLRNVMLEEIERSEDEQHWLITLGFDYVPTVASFIEALRKEPQRIYKIIEVDAKTGEALSMKMRTL